MNPHDEELIELHGEFVHELKDSSNRYSIDNKDINKYLDDLMKKILPN